MIDGIDMLDYIVSEIELYSILDLERVYSYTVDKYLTFTNSTQDRMYITASSILQRTTMLLDDFCEKFYVLCLGGERYHGIWKYHIVLYIDECMIIKIFEILEFCKNILGAGRV